MRQVRECLRLRAPVHRVSIASGKRAGVTDSTARIARYHANGDVNDNAERVANREIFVSVGGKEASSDASGGGVDSKVELMSADAVIMTVPLSLLQQEVVLFDPPLPEVRRRVPLNYNCGWR